LFIFAASENGIVGSKIFIAASGGQILDNKILLKATRQDKLLMVSDQFEPAKEENIKSKEPTAPVMCNILQEQSLPGTSAPEDSSVLANFSVIYGSFDFDGFEIPYHRFGQTVKKKLDDKVFLNPDDLDVITKNVVDEMRQFRIKFGRTDCRIVVKKMSRQYPDSFLVNRNNVFDPNSDVALISKINNHNNYRGKRILAEQNIIEEQPKIPLSKRKFAKLCATTTMQWNPPRPQTETSESIAAKQSHLKQLYLKRSSMTKEEKDLVLSYMSCTFADQRCFLNKMDPPPSMEATKEAWPFLYETEYLYQHFQTEMGMPVTTLKISITDLHEQIIDYAKSDKKSRVFFVNDTSEDSIDQCLKLLAYLLGTELDLMVKRFEVSET
jgi:hypothetical protein